MVEIDKGEVVNVLKTSSREEFERAIDAGQPVEYTPIGRHLQMMGHSLTHWHCGYMMEKWKDYTWGCTIAVPPVFSGGGYWKCVECGHEIEMLASTKERSSRTFTPMVPKIKIKQFNR